MTDRLFITGTGTEVGKTFVSGVIAWGCELLSLSVRYWKPVQTGETIDSEAVTKIAAKCKIMPTTYSYPDPMSPDQASAKARLPEVSLNMLEGARRVAIREDILLVESAGGVMVPLNRQGETWLDFASELNCPVLIVGNTGLGTLNHSALTIQAVEDRGLNIAGIVLSGERHQANEQSLSRLFPHLPIHWLPHLPDHLPRQFWGDEAKRIANFALTCIKVGKDERKSWLGTDTQHIWHPYTQHKTASAPREIVRAKGAWIELRTGEHLLDGTSSWWVNNIGHGRPEIARALHRQQQTADHVLFAGATHRPATEVATRLVDLTGPQLNRLFFSDNGSTSVEVALKMAYQYHVNQGDLDRRQILAFRGGYHGDTFGAMAVSQTSGFHSPFEPLLFKCLWADPVTEHRSQVCPDGHNEMQERSKALEALFEKQGRRLSCVIIEPLIQGASGMNIQPITWLQRLADLCRTYEVPLILDEVFTGFGRVGNYFAFQRAGILPDIICLSKAITGGTLPFAVTMAQERFFDGFLGEENDRALLHGHSYTANPIGCAAACCAMDILRKENLVGRAQFFEKEYRRWISDEGSKLKVGQPRALGGVLAFELPESGLGNYFDSRGKVIPDLAQKHGLFLRPLGNTIYFAPPLSTTDFELYLGLEGLKATVKDYLKL